MLTAAFVLAVCMAAGAAPAKAWAAVADTVEYIDKTTFTGFSEPSASETPAENLAKLQCTTTGVEFRLKEWRDSATNTPVSSFEVGKSYFLCMRLFPIDSTYRFGPSSAYSGNITGLPVKESHNQTTDNEDGSLVEYLWIETPSYTVAEPAPEEPTSGYKLTSGDGSAWTKGSADGLTFVSDAPFDELLGVKVDGKELGAEDFTAAPGSTVVTLRPGFLQALDTGRHTVAIVSGEPGGAAQAVEGTFTVKEAAAEDAAEDEGDDGGKAEAKPASGANGARTSPKTGAAAAPLAAVAGALGLGAVAAARRAGRRDGR